VKLRIAKELKDTLDNSQRAVRDSMFNSLNVYTIDATYDIIINISVIGKKSATIDVVRNGVSSSIDNNEAMLLISELSAN
jgi:hypothetical protein